LQNSSTLGDALDCASRFIFTYSPGIAFSERPAERDDRVLVAYELDVPHPVGSGVQDAELSMGLAARVVTLLSDGRHHLRSVRFTHSRCAPRAVYRKYFGVPVRFESACTALEVDRADLDLSIPSSHRGLRDRPAYLVTHSASAGSRSPGACEIILRSRHAPGNAECVARARDAPALCSAARCDGTRFGRASRTRRSPGASIPAQEDLPLAAGPARLQRAVRAHPQLPSMVRAFATRDADAPSARRRRAGRRRAAD
jgi:hypothetical protein